MISNDQYNIITPSINNARAYQLVRYLSLNEGIDGRHEC